MNGNSTDSMCHKHEVLDGRPDPDCPECNPHVPQAYEASVTATAGRENNLRASVPIDALRYLDATDGDTLRFAKRDDGLRVTVE